MYCEKILEKIKYLNEIGIVLWRDDDKIKYRAKNGKMTQEVLNWLRENKQEILECLSSKQNIINTEIMHGPYKLTDLQGAYLIGRSSLFAYGDVSCRIYMEVNYESLDSELVEKIFNKIIKRHDMLRTVVHSNGYQETLQSVPFYKIKNYTSLNNEELNNIRDEMSNAIYETDKWPLFDIRHSNFNKCRSIIHFSIEFLIVDWVSIEIILNEFENMYVNNVDNYNELNYSFRQYVNELDLLKQSDRYNSDKSYWINKIEKFPKGPILPCTVTGIKNKFKRYNFKFSTDAWNTFKEISKKYNITPTVALFGMYSLVISRWSENKSFCMNLTLLNRPQFHKDINLIVGDFSSIMLLCLDRDFNEENIVDYLLYIQEKLFETLDHSSFSGIEVLRELRKQKGIADSFMPIVFTSGIGLGKKTSDMNREFGDFGISQTPQVFIDCQVMDIHDGLYVNWDVREGVFPEGMIENMFDEYVKLINNYIINEGKSNFIVIYNDNNPLYFHEHFPNKNYYLLQNEKINSANEEKEFGLEKLENESEEKIYAICKKVLENDLISLDENFYNLGADSLILARIAGMVKEVFEEKNINISYDVVLKQILDRPSISSIISMLRKNADNSNLCDAKLGKHVKNSNAVLTFFSEEEEGPVRILLHAGLGTMNFMRFLISELKLQKKGSVVGISVKDPETFCSLDPDMAIFHIADDYAKQIYDLGYKDVQIVGACVGGLIALEVSRRLVEMGINVINFTLIDSLPIPFLYEDDVIFESMFISNFFVNFEQIFGTIKQEDLDRIIQEILSKNKGSIPAESSLNIEDSRENMDVINLLKELNNMSMKERFGIYCKRIKEIHNNDVPVDMAMSLYKVFRQSFRYARFLPEAYMGDILYLRAMEGRESMANVVQKENNAELEFWENICLGELRVKNIPGNHMNCIEDESNAVVLGKILGEQI